MTKQAKRLNATAKRASEHSNSKRVTSKRVAQSAASDTSKRATSKRAATTTKRSAASNEKFSAAKVLAECGISNAKVGRALLRAHNVERSERAIKAFFAARAKAKAKA